MKRNHCHDKLAEYLWDSKNARPGEMAMNVYTDRLLDALSDEDIALAHGVFDSRSGSNLGTAVIDRTQHGWKERQESSFYALLDRGYDPHLPDGRGRYPAMLALDTDHLAMDEVDLRYALSRGLDPIRHYPDGAQGLSMLSFSFGREHRKALMGLFVLFEASIGQALLALPRNERQERLEQLSGTVDPANALAFARIQTRVIDHATATTDRVRPANRI